MYGAPPFDELTSCSLARAISVSLARAFQIVRTASFSRRGKKIPPPVRSPSETEADNSSESRSPTPDSPEDSAHAADDLDIPSVMSDKLYGWLKKRNSRGAWSKRYFYVDEARGTLAYAKSHKGRNSKPSAVLPLADITRIEPDTLPSAFVISCPPIHLTVQAVSIKERKNWIRQLELRVDVWKLKQAEKMPVASMQTLLDMAPVSYTHLTLPTKA